jgi:non-haem Fe2+, alpha-ketoglutarate-dependent halogenase
MKEDIKKDLGVGALTADGRDLSFKPVINTNPQHLTTTQIEHYNREGYILPIDLFTPAEITRWRAYFDSLLVTMAQLKDGRDGNYAINGYHVCCEGLWDLVTHPKILGYVEDIVGPDIVVWGSHFFCKQPHDTKHVPWHQDASYWPFTPARTVTVWLAIDDVDTENSAMRFIPRTHNIGHIDWKQTQKDAVLQQEIENAERFGEPVSDILRAGQMSLHADMLVHGSEPNKSSRRRCGFTARYSPTSVRSINPDWARQAILCRGVDTDNYWSNLPRPIGDNLSPDKKPKSIGAN